jgi:predicted RNase H-like nuclease
MTTLLVGFDSAWTSTHCGGLVGILQKDDGSFCEFGPPQNVDFRAAEDAICEWQAALAPTSTVVLLDQPTIVKNATGERPVENLVRSPVGRRHGGMQPSNTSKRDMFGKQAPVWRFLRRFGGAADPLGPVTNTRVLETYPVLALIALGWALPDSRPTGRLPKYNPANRKSFTISDWRYVCRLAARALRELGLAETPMGVDEACGKGSPTKADQDRLDACLCLLVALHLASQKECLMVGDIRTGYIVVPYGAELHAELVSRCVVTGRAPADWVLPFRLQMGAPFITAD